MYKVYIIKSIKTGWYYIGYTCNLERRLDYHNKGLNRSTRGRGPWRVVYTEEYKDKILAIKREKFLKRQKSRTFYKKLMSGCGAVG